MSLLCVLHEPRLTMQMERSPALLTRSYFSLGLVALALVGFGLWPTEQPAPRLKQPLTLNLPDLDGDAKPETLRVEPGRGGRSQLTLVATRGRFSHPVMRIATPDETACFEKQLGGWRLTDAMHEEALTVVPLANDKGAPPDLVMAGGGQGRRYRWLDRGFLKLESHQVIPGFSVGLLLIGDPARVLTALGSGLSSQGTWKSRYPGLAPMQVALDAKQRIHAITYRQRGLKTQSGLATGAPLTEVMVQFPGNKQGPFWVSPQYGLTAKLSKRDRLQAVTIARPWHAAKAK